MERSIVSEASDDPGLLRHGGRPSKFWVLALSLIVTIKYVLILLNADHRGEGGTLSLLSLMMTWRSGTKLLFEKTRTSEVPPAKLVNGLERNLPPIVSGMSYWQDKLFIMLARNADDASRYFRLPIDRVVEVDSQISV
jgi:K+ transporter